MRRWDRKRATYVRGILRQGPTETAYAYLRARRRRRNEADEELELSASDRLVFDGAADFDPADLTRTAEAVAAWERAGAAELRSLQWFLPWFHLVTGGGIHTVARFADHFARHHRVANRFCVYDRSDRADARDVAAKLALAFPALQGSHVTAAGEPLTPSDAAIATAWTSVFPLVRHRDAGARFFFVQDHEPAFHPAGAASAVLEQAARVGLPGIVNTPGLADVYRGYGNRAVSFLPAVDLDRCHPPAQPRPQAPVRVFFYARPSQPRNAFGLGIAALRLLKRRLGEAVEIVCAGEDWNPGQYGVADVLDNLGQLEDLDAVADLYRSCHVGLCFMLTPHPSYQPLEFMACGMATVSNRNPHTSWALRHEHNALLADPLPRAVADQLARLVEDRPLLERLSAAGPAEVSGRRWEEEIEGVWEALTTHPDRFTGG